MPAGFNKLFCSFGLGKECDERRLKIASNRRNDDNPLSQRAEQWQRLDLLVSSLELGPGLISATRSGGEGSGRLPVAGRLEERELSARNNTAGWEVDQSPSPTALGVV